MNTKPYAPREGGTREVQREGYDDSQHPLYNSRHGRKIYKVLLHALVTNVGYRYRIWQPGPRCELTIVC